jgi:cytochrome c556
MKIYLSLFIILLAACNGNEPVKTNSAITSDSLHKMMEQYAPGLGEIMGGIQTHHAKLWYAGINDNWKLAQYEIDELKERFEQARTVETDRPEVKMIPMMYPSIDSINAAISHKNLAQFKSGFQLLTASCNSCHSANNFEFNIITIPTAPPVSNQDFKVH